MEEIEGERVNAASVAFAEPEGPFSTGGVPSSVPEGGQGGMPVRCQPDLLDTHDQLFTHQPCESPGRWGATGKIASSRPILGGFPKEPHGPVAPHLPQGDPAFTRAFPPCP